MRRMTMRRRRIGAQKAIRRVRYDTIVTWSLRLPDSLDRALKARAHHEGRSANMMAVVLLTEALKKELARLSDEDDRRMEAIAEGANHETQPDL